MGAIFDCGCEIGSGVCGGRRPSPRIEYANAADAADGLLTHRQAREAAIERRTIRILRTIWINLRVKGRERHQLTEQNNRTHDHCFAHSESLFTAVIIIEKKIGSRTRFIKTYWNRKLAVSS